MITKNHLFWYSILLFFLSIPLLTQAEKTEDQNLKICEITTEDEFLSVLDNSKNQKTVVYCYMNNCPFCKELNPAIQKLSHDKKNSDILFKKAHGPHLKIHTHVKRESNNNFSIPGYPAILFLDGGKIVDIVLGAQMQLLQTKIKKFHTTQNKNSTKKSF